MKKMMVKVLAAAALVAMVVVFGCSCSKKTEIRTEVVGFGFEPNMVEEIIEEEIDIEQFVFEKTGETWNGDSKVTYYRWSK